MTGYHEQAAGSGIRRTPDSTPAIRQRFQTPLRDPVRCSRTTRNPQGGMLSLIAAIAPKGHVGLTRSSPNSGVAAAAHHMRCVVAIGGATCWLERNAGLLAGVLVAAGGMWSAAATRPL